MTDPELERWRLVLGEPASAVGALGADAAARDAALEWLYGRDGELDQRDVRRGGKAGGDGASVLTTVDWLNDINRLFPQETIERLQRDAVERYEINDIVTDAAVLETIEPNPALLRAVLQTKHLMNPDILRLARRIVEAVVRDLMAKMATEVRASFTGTRARRPSRWKQARDFDMTRTLRGNLGHYRPDEGRLYIETPHFFSRTRKQVEQWQVILLVDQSGSMVDSVIHSAVTAACLWGLPGVRTHLVAFDTDVVDLTSEVDDPVELLMKVQLGGGTDIGRAVRYGAGLIEQPRRAIVVLISDFYEGGSTSMLIRSVREMVEQGTKVLGLAALDEQANPSYDRDTAQRLADVGASVGAMTPGQLAAFVAEQVGR
ncbi:VWA domain-containing protein [Actinoplanes sp. NPDC051494]|uniref:VWA domain-containing protein n=1 Tax=Actinoplanes sp. NPDC051494 TaxID=3363907 RepID=UPI0037BBE606